MKTKICTQCKETFPESNFFWRNKEKGLKQAACKQCACAARVDYYKRNKDKEKAYDKERRIKQRKKVYDYLSKTSCVDCGEADPVVLEFDHKNPKSKKYAVSDMMDRGWKTIMIEIKKCDVRCSNCHKRRTAKQMGWYKFN